jgi:hypothetical protein
MSYRSRYSRRVNGPIPRDYIPCVETLEDRQPVSDTILGGMFAWSVLGLTSLVGETGPSEAGRVDQTRLPLTPAQPDFAGPVPARGANWADGVLPVVPPPTERDADRTDPWSFSSALAATVPDNSLPFSSGSTGRPELGGLLLGQWTTRPAPPQPEASAEGQRSPTGPEAALRGAGLQPLAVPSPTSADRALSQALQAAAEARAAGRLVVPTAPTPDARQALEASLAENPLQAPVSYELNEGQTDPTVRFLTRGPDYTLFLTGAEAVLSFGDSGTGAAVIRMRLTGGNPAPQVTGLNPLPVHVNYFLGNDPAGWHANVPTFARVRYQDVYPGIDLVYHGSAGQPEYDFVLAAGADPSTIRLNYAGADQVTIDAQGNLVVQAGGDQLQQPPPVAYQIENGVRRPVPSAFQLDAGHEVHFTVGAHDPGRPLVIDPYFTFSTYLGGSGADQGWGIATDPARNVFAAGFTNSPNFPGTPPPDHSRDAFVSRFSADGRTLLYSTILGGDRTDEARAVAVDNQDNAYVTGFTDSQNFPTVNPFQDHLIGRRSAFVTELDPAGRPVYSSYLGGPNREEGRGIAVDPLGFAYVTGITSSQSGFIFNSGGLQSQYGGGKTDAFVVQILPRGQVRGFSTYLGGDKDEDLDFNHTNSPEISGGIAVGLDGNIYVTGTTASDNFPTTTNAFQPTLGGRTDAFVTVIDPRALMFRYSTYLGGSGNDQGHGITIGPDNSVYVTGSTDSPNFPVFRPFQANLGGAGATNAFVTRLLPNGAPPLFSTYLGGSGVDQGNGIAVTRLGSAYVTGATSSTDFPHPDAFQSIFGGGQSDAFLAKFQPGGDLQHLRASTFLGGPGDDYAQAVAIIPYYRPRTGPCAGGTPPPDGEECDDHAVVTGFSSGGYPTTGNAFQPNFGGPPWDAIVSEVADCPCQPTNVGFTVDSNGVAHLSWTDPCEDYTSEYDIRYWINGVEQTAPPPVHPPDTSIDLNVGTGDPSFEVKSHNSCCDAPAVHVP